MRDNDCSLNVKSLRLKYLEVLTLELFPQSDGISDKSVGERLSSKLEMRSSFLPDFRFIFSFFYFFFNLVHHMQGVKVTETQWVTGCKSAMNRIIAKKRGTNDN